MGIFHNQQFHNTAKAALKQSRLQWQLPTSYIAGRKPILFR